MGELRFRRTADAEHLHFLRAKRRDADLRHPYRARRHCADFLEFRRPFVNRPMIPVERKTVYRDHVNFAQPVLTPECFHEAGVNGRDAAENARNTLIDSPLTSTRRAPCSNAGTAPTGARINGVVFMALVVIAAVTTIHHGDTETQGTEERGDTGTRGRGDTGTRRRGDTATRDRGE